MYEKIEYLAITCMTYTGGWSDVRNAERDGEVLSTLFKKLGARTHLLQEPKAKEDIDEAVQQWQQRVTARGKDCVGAISLHCHGVELQGKNYFVPCGFTGEGLNRAKRHMFCADVVMDAFADAGNNTNIALFDACRNTPKKFDRGMRDGDSESGMVPMRLGTGVFAGFATSPGTTASDGPTGGNSLFTMALKKHIATGRSIFHVFLDVVRDVKRDSLGKQVPFSQNTLDGDIVFPLPPDPVPTPFPKPPAPTTEEEWRQLEADFRNDSKLAKFAGELRTAKILDGDGQGLQDAQATLIARLLGYSSNLLVLDLESNSVGDAGAKALGEALAKNSSNLLENLYLRGNFIGDTGATALAGALENSSNLLELSLLNNNIGPTGATALAGALENSSNLQELWLEGNVISDSGASALAKSLQHSSNLQDLWIRANNIGTTGKQALENAVKDKKCTLHF